MRRGRFEAASRGAALVEMVVVTPLLVLLFAATTELGWALHQYDLLTGATRGGARYAATYAAGSAGVVSLDTTLTNQTRNVVVYGNPGGNGTPLLPNFSASTVAVTAVDASHVQVQATYQYQPLFARLPFISGVQTQFQFKSAAVMAAL